MDDSDDASDLALMARVAKGDETAYRTLSRRHVGAMLGLARLNPWLARRLATGSLAAGLLRICFDWGVHSLGSGD